MWAWIKNVVMIPHETKVDFGVCRDVTNYTTTRPTNSTPGMQKPTKQLTVPTLQPSGYSLQNHKACHFLKILKMTCSTDREKRIQNAEIYVCLPLAVRSVGVLWLFEVSPPA